ncbi:fimbrial protein [Pseudomonas rubra]|uniref:Type 1 fimbrial protein n=1 Tax=Pseudomonas rubra TaxID=2942627 RepID=A0ABT5P8W9_9PSED|nr:fimbrial protein [Pseudomonas rubra]MDD1014616.1 type 1 fimbrial protein [Pseudomonas rubra]MDD1040565.1 type 1 fimbrial protein [Pseudomonas rubra]MDD1153591.1 type 1 fimbrial protein [Pseudomonas rubra]
MITSKLGAVLALSLLAGITTTAQASDGRIEFTGNVFAQTCTINGGSGANNFTVPMRPARTDDLGSAGNTYLGSAFQIRLTGCNPPAGRIDIEFLTGSSVDPASGRLKADAGGAANVQVQLRNANNGAIHIGRPQGEQNTIPVQLANGAATFNYSAHYYATGTASAGPIATRVEYLIRYI